MDHRISSRFAADLDTRAPDSLMVLSGLCFCLLWTCPTALDYLTVLPCRLGRTTQDYRRNICAQAYTVTVYFYFSVMADDWKSRAAVD